MSFNLRYGTADDGPNAWPFRRSAALETIRAFRPDLLGVQEALAFQLAEILEAMPGYAVVGVGRDDGVEEGEHAAILYDAARLKVVENGTFWFSEEPDVPGSRFPDCFHPRICTWAVFGQGFAFYNLHLDNESGLSRERSVAQLVARPRVVPTIVGGDFNAGEADACIDAMREAGFRDSYRVLNPLDPSGTYHGFGGVEDAEKIDYIWIDDRWAVLEAAVPDSKVQGVWPSDHHPVTAVLALGL